MLESKFQSDLIKELKELFPGCVVLKNDAEYMQGIPDLLILHNAKWAALECKESFFARYRPNQEYYLDLLNNMSFAMMICPENKEDVLSELQLAFRPRRSARVSKRFQKSLE